jgi:hypothetical protein
MAGRRDAQGEIRHDLDPVDGVDAVLDDPDQGVDGEDAVLDEVDAALDEEVLVAAGAAQDVEDAAPGAAAAAQGVEDAAPGAAAADVEAPGAAEASDAEVQDAVVAWVGAAQVLENLRLLVRDRLLERAAPVLVQIRFAMCSYLLCHE